MLVLFQPYLQATVTCDLQITPTQTCKSQPPLTCKPHPPLTCKPHLTDLQTTHSWLTNPNPLTHNSISLTSTPLQGQSDLDLSYSAENLPATCWNSLSLFSECVLLFWGLEVPAVTLEKHLWLGSLIHGCFCTAIPQPKFLQPVKS